MILSDREMHAAIDRGAIRIEPRPRGTFFTSTAVDLTLALEIRRWRLPSSGMRSQICPASKEFNYTEVAKEWTEKVEFPATGYDMAPKEFLLGWTVEKIQLPHRSRIAARVEGKSSLARLGLGVHVTAPTIHSGFGYDQAKTNGGEGTSIQLEMWNIGPLTIQLMRGMAICQLILEEVHGTPDTAYQGRFTRQGPQSGA
jgi:dCTP deaminase